MTNRANNRLCTAVFWLMILPILFLRVDSFSADSTIAGTARVKDTYIQDRLGGDDNYGGASTMQVGWKDDDYPNSRRRIYLWFDTPRNMDSCAACTLSLYLTALDGDADTMDIFWATRDVADYVGNNTVTGDPEDGEMTWLAYYDDDNGTDSLWNTSGGDYDNSLSIGMLAWDGNEATDQWRKIALDKQSIDSLLNGRRANYGLFLVGRVGGSYGNGNTTATFRQVDYGDNSYGPRVTFYGIGASSSTQPICLRRRMMSRIGK